MDEPRRDRKPYPRRLDLPDDSEFAYRNPGKLPDGRKPLQLPAGTGVSECGVRATCQVSEPPHRSAVSRAEPKPVLQYQRILIPGSVHQWKCRDRDCALW